MTFTFPRVSAGLYEVQKHSNILGFIRKVNASKWLVADVVDTPQHVSKTLKDAKDACINLIIFDVVDNTSESVYNDSVRVDSHISSIELQRKMLENMSKLQVKVPTLQPISF
jgi:hypothetical protein